MERYFRIAPSPLACLAAAGASSAAAATASRQPAGGGAAAEPAWDLACAALRLIELMPLQRRLHDHGALLRLLQHAEPDVRWAAARSLALLFNLVGAFQPEQALLP